MGIKKLAGALTISAGALLSGCNEITVYERAEQYMGNKLQKELNEVVGDRIGINEHSILTQSKLDSVAYRDVFETTQAAKDSSKVAEFTKIAQQNRSNDVYKKLADKATVKEYKNILKDSKKVRWNDYWGHEYIQHKIDSIAYRQFFEKHNLLNDKTLKLFNKVSNQVKPK